VSIDSIAHLQRHSGTVHCGTVRKQASKQAVHPWAYCAVTGIIDWYPPLESRDPSRIPYLLHDLLAGRPMWGRQAV